MQVIRASVLGFCMGVRRAVELAYREAGGGGKIYTLGSLIHNPYVSVSLRNQGIGILKEEELPPDLQGATVIIRAHGITPALEGALVRRGARLADATCPKVKSGQMKARALTEGGYRIFLAGEAQHGEVIGLCGYAPDCLVVGNPWEAKAQAEKLSSQGRKVKTALLGQTTISSEEYQSIAAEIQRYFPDLEIIDTICQATKERQRALTRLCDAADAVVIVGGKESANTRRLLAIAQARSKPAWLVESVGDIPADIDAYSTVGLSAGASTPDNLITLIERALISHCERPVGDTG
ncbi:MAG: 4-hydroxy-3-methylbut-2-enyl diphosphate reductase [Spirochaetaceae bacterium]|jgi:4-hydroxy-3-methylbut-2-enyl diphosphate reductase|nr:4-hydroxy-3-methylbut-2-enyl diphosphate reductase [Spirochaetaceae bacterium]